LSLQGLGKAFGGRAVLQPCDLEVQSGELVVVMGPSGCGKSTLLRLIAGLETPSSGCVLIGGVDMTDVAPADRGVAMVFQSYALYPHLNVEQNIAFPLRMAKMPRAEIERRVQRAAESLDIVSLLKRRPRELSGGQRQRVSIGRAIVREPRVMLLDEPLSNLDGALRGRMRHAFARLHGELKTTMIYVTHDQQEAMTLAERIVVMDAGRIEQSGSPMALYQRPASVKIATAIGSPAMNLMAVALEQVEPDGAWVRLEDGARVRAAVRAPASAIGAAATLGVRPEHLRLDRRGPFGGRVELFERLGPSSFVHLGEPGRAQTLIAQLPGDQQVTLGEVLRFRVEAVDAQLFDIEGRAYPNA
jgi:multiple sugar transport system ATP-binding protein